jgi:hypothetical protein
MVAREHTPTTLSRLWVFAATVLDIPDGIRYTRHPSRPPEYEIHGARKGAACD